MTLAVVLTAHNEASVIEDALKSVQQLANEIIVVDNESKDKTVKIAQKYTRKIYPHQNTPLVLNKPKNYGFSKASADWILSLDPDERVSPELAQEINLILNSAANRKNSPAGYWIPRKNIVFGQWIKHGIWYPDRQLRLFRRNQGKFPEKHNHEYLEVKGETADLKGHLIHQNYQSITQYVDKINHYYTDNEAEALLKSGQKLKWSDAIRLPASDFILNFFKRQSYRDGLHGLVLSTLQAFYTFIVFAKAWEKQGFWQYNPKDFTRTVKKELKAKEKEFAWWYTKELAPWFLKPKTIVKKLLST